MDAVRRFIQDCGGTIAIDLGKADSAAPACRPFQFVITLPFNLFEEAAYQEDRRAA